MHNIVIQYIYILQNDHNKSCYHLSPCKVITILLTVLYLYDIYFKTRFSKLFRKGYSLTLPMLKLPKSENLTLITKLSSNP